jgi:hypothetical protein
MMSNEIGVWNPAWGPEPAKVEGRRPARAHPRGPQRDRYGWHLVECPNKGCANAGKGPWLVYCPTVRGAAAIEQKFPERYDCAVCGTEMVQRPLRVKND